MLEDWMFLLNWEEFQWGTFLQILDDLRFKWIHLIVAQTSIWSKDKGFWSINNTFSFIYWSNKLCHIWRKNILHTQLWCRIIVLKLSCVEVHCFFIRYYDMENQWRKVHWVAKCLQLVTSESKARVNNNKRQY